jgi:hypothetical protein
MKRKGERIMKNGKAIDWEGRLARLEADVQEIKAMLQTQRTSQEPWWKSFVGMYANDPVADEVRKITEEIRDKERRKARRTPTRKKSNVSGTSR